MCVTIFPKDFHHFNNHEALLSLTSKPLDFKQPPPPPPPPPTPPLPSNSKR